MFQNVPVKIFVDGNGPNCFAVQRSSTQAKQSRTVFCCLLNLWDHTKKCCMLNLCYFNAPDLIDYLRANIQLLVLIYVCITEKRISKLVYVTCLSLKVVRKTSIWNTFQRFLMVQSPVKRPNHWTCRNRFCQRSKSAKQIADKQIYLLSKN